MPSQTSLPMIALDQISFSYTKDKPLFVDFSWRVQAGETWSVLGMSGCGKTTLLYLLAGLQYPNSGSIAIQGQPLTRPRPLTGLILQDYGLLPWATVRENALLGLKLRDFYGPDGTHAPKEKLGVDVSVVDGWLKRLQIDGVQDCYPSQISGGQRQRTAIARTLSLSPDLLLMDEPFSSLDAVISEDLQDLTLQLCREQGITLVVITHSIEEAAILGQKVLLLGLAPQTQPNIIDNPRQGQPDYRYSPEYLHVVNDLRSRMGAA
ncbi:MAG: ABC transporter ATP-binding protein [Anaerolineaceae bacterium]